MLDFSPLNNCSFAVIGHPIWHSKSPVMHNAALDFLQKNQRYGKLDVPPEALEEFTLFARTHLNGFNVTVPHKSAILPFLDEISEEAALAGSVNTVLCREGKLYGTTTDGWGLARALKEAFALEIAGGTFLILGAGGAAKAIGAHFALQNAREIVLVNRSLDRAEALAGSLKNACPALNVSVCTPSSPEAVEFAGAADVVLQATSLGLKDSDPLPAPESLLAAARRGMDLIYHQTAFQRFLLQRQIPIADGKDMLLFQGAKALELWLGVPAPVEVMRRALQEA